MFPRPIEKASPGARAAYEISLPIALVVWLLPPGAIALTAMRPGIDINQGNVFGYRYGYGYGSAIATVLFLIMLVYISYFLTRMWLDEREAR